MKVTLVNSFFPPWRGGAETYAFSLAEALVTRGHQVTVHCGCTPLLAGRSSRAGISIVRHRVITKVYGTPVMPSLIHELRNVDSDVLHGNFPSPFIAFTVAATSRSLRIPAVLTWHNDLPPVTSAARVLIETHDRIILPRYIQVYRRIIATSEYYARRSRILHSLQRLVQVVPNGVDCTRFNPAQYSNIVREKLQLGDKFTVIFVAALTKWHRYKGLDVLLKAFRHLTQVHDAKLIVVGDGELKTYYKSISHSLGLDSSVCFVGDVNDAELPQYYSASNASVLPSKDMSEGFGLTLLEANACGIPVIATEVGGIPSVVKNGHNGILVPPNDPQSIAGAILTLIKSPKVARGLGRNGRKFAETRDWKNTAASMENVYQETLN